MRDRPDIAELSFHAAAEECRRLAAKAIDPIERQQLHRAADQWLKLAQFAFVAPEGSTEEQRPIGTKPELPG